MPRQATTIISAGRVLTYRSSFCTVLVCLGSGVDIGNIYSPEANIILLASSTANFLAVDLVLSTTMEYARPWFNLTKAHQKCGLDQVSQFQEDS